MCGSLAETRYWRWIWKDSRRYAQRGSYYLQLLKRRAGKEKSDGLIPLEIWWLSCMWKNGASCRAGSNEALETRLTFAHKGFDSLYRVKHPKARILPWPSAQQQVGTLIEAGLRLSAGMKMSPKTSIYFAVFYLFCVQYSPDPGSVKPFRN